MDRETFLRRVRELGAIGDEQHAERASAATLVVLSELLMPDEAERCRHRLPRELGSHLVGREPALVFGTDELAARVARNEHAVPGIAREHAEAVCAAIGEALDTDTRALLVRRLDFGLGRLFARASKTEKRSRAKRPVAGP